MRRRVSGALLCVACIGAPFLSACDTSARQRVLVLAAASVGDTIEEIAAAARGSSGIDVRVSTGSSNALAAQIVEGAPAHILLSASAEWAEHLRGRGLVARETVLLSNELVIVVPPGNPAGVRGPGDLSSKSVRKVALAGENVPAGKYAKQALEASGAFAPIASKVVRGQDVRMALGHVERGEAEAGIVYATDARASRAVETVFTFPADSHERIVYPLLLLQRGARNPSARFLFDHLTKTEAGEVFRQRGFVTPER